MKNKKKNKTAIRLRL